jgi:hypothetical protein
MPLSGSIEGCGGSRTENAVYRLLRAEGGPVEVVVEWMPRFDYAQSTTQVMRTPSGFLAWGGSDSLVLAGVPEGLEVAEDDSASSCGDASSCALASGAPSSPAGAPTAPT